MSLFPRSARVPVIGRPQVHKWRCVVSFSCSCGTGSPMLITAADQAEVCDGCGETYQLQQLIYSRNAAGNAGVELTKIPRATARPTSEQ